MGGLGAISFAPLVLGGRWLPGLTVVTDHPALACLGSQYAGWRLDRDGYFAMASGPGRALIRAEELYDDLDVDERAEQAVLCLETRDAPPDELAAYVAERAGVGAGRPDAPLRADREPGRRRPDRRARGRDRAAQAARARVRRPPRGERRSAAARCRRSAARTRRRSGARTTPSSTAARSSSPWTRPTTSSEPRAAAALRRPRATTASRSARSSRRADWDFYEIDPLLFSPAEVRLVSAASGRSFHAGGVDAGACSSAPSGDDRGDRHDDDQPRRHGELRGDGRGVGRRGDRHQAVPRHAHAAQPAATGAAVVNLTDDILLFTQAALDDPHPPTRPAAAIDGAVLADACSWREVPVEAIEATDRGRA